MKLQMTAIEPLPLLATFALAALFCACIIWAIRPLLLQHAMARPNARSSHRIPTPQGGGIAVIAAALSLAVAGAGVTNFTIPAAVFAATAFMTLVGFADDIKSIPVLPRLLLQAAAVGAIVFTAPSELRMAPAIPLPIERTLLLLAGLWFVNLVNFMDGLDLMTVAEVVPATAAMTLLGWFGDFPASATIVAAALCGAMIGFSPFNRPVAKLFLGDVGSLPIGLLLGWCLLQLAWQQHLIAALLLPAYYLADATITLSSRIARREPFWSAHRTHYYQRATDNGFTVAHVVGEVSMLNIVLAVLAIVSVRANSALVSTLAAVVGAAAVAFLLYRFSRKLPPQQSA